MAFKDWVIRWRCVHAVVSRHFALKTLSDRQREGERDRQTDRRKGTYAGRRTDGRRVLVRRRSPNELTNRKVVSQPRHILESSTSPAAARAAASPKNLPPTSFPLRLPTQRASITHSLDWLLLIVHSRHRGRPYTRAALTLMADINSLSTAAFPSAFRRPPVTGRLFIQSRFQRSFAGKPTSSHVI